MRGPARVPIGARANRLQPLSTSTGAGACIYGGRRACTTTDTGGVTFEKYSRVESDAGRTEAKEARRGVEAGGGR